MGQGLISSFVWSPPSTEHIRGTARGCWQEEAPLALSSIPGKLWKSEQIIPGVLSSLPWELTQLQVFKNCRGTITFLQDPRLLSPTPPCVPSWFCPSPSLITRLQAALLLLREWGWAGGRESQDGTEGVRVVSGKSLPTGRRRKTAMRFQGLLRHFIPFSVLPARSLWKLLGFFFFFKSLESQFYHLIACGRPVFRKQGSCCPSWLVILKSLWEWVMKEKVPEDRWQCGIF